jgi:hypothetical protein
MLTIHALERPRMFEPPTGSVYLPPTPCRGVHALVHGVGYECHVYGTKPRVLFLVTFFFGIRISRDTDVGLQ